MKYILLLILFQCSGSRKPITQRLPPSKAPLETVARPAEEFKSPTYYVKKDETKVISKYKPNESGSLMNTEDPRTHFFIQKKTYNVGDIVPIKVSSIRTEQKPADPASGGAASAQSTDQVEAEILKSFPDFQPDGKKPGPSMVKEIKAVVTNVKENGDVELSYERSSVIQDQAHELKFAATIPQNKADQLDPLSTNDLTKVQWKESHQGQLVERESSSWEDEYSLRLSGFDEAKSKSALALEEKEKQLIEAKKKMETHLKTFTNERQRFAKERDEFRVKKEVEEEKNKERDEKLAAYEKEEKERKEKAEADKNKAELAANKEEATKQDATKQDAQKKPADAKKANDTKKPVEAKKDTPSPTKKPEAKKS